MNGARVNGRRVAAPFALLTLLGLAGCPGPAPAPAPPRCESPVREAALDDVTLDAWFERGGQGSNMIALNIDLLGPEAPVCALVLVEEVRVRGALIGGADEVVARTDAIPGGRRISWYRVVDDFDSDGAVTASAYGFRRTVAARPCRTCFELDGGVPPADAGLDAGAAGDAGADASTDDAG